VVAQHPFYWYSAPALIKEWIDLVLTHGWAYGEGGTALTGKTWLSAITSGGSEDSYGPSGGNRFSVAEFMRPFEATVALCHMRWLEPFVVHASHLVSQTELADAALSYRERILALQRDG
jgi:glutathione-regulated potassium-efflux system ancillary protein KefG